MRSPTEIYDNVEALVTRRLEPADSGFELMDAVGAPRATTTKLRAETVDGSFAWTRMLRFSLVEAGATGLALDRMRVEEEAKPGARRARLVVAYDGNNIAIRDTRVGDQRRLSLQALAHEAETLFPLSRHDRQGILEKASAFRLMRFPP